MNARLQDLRYGLRLLIRNRGFSAVAILTFAIGIAATTSVFSVVNVMLLRSLPYPDPDRLVRVWSTGAVPKGAFLLTQQANLASLDGVAGFAPAGFNLTEAGEAERLDGNRVSANLFTLLGAQPEIGRVFHKGEDRPGADRVVVLSNRLWKTRFGGDRQILGRSLKLDDVPYEVVGVMPASFQFPSFETELWVPFHYEPQNAVDLWAVNSILMIGRLKPQATAPQATAQLRALVPQIKSRFPWPMPNTWGANAEVVSLQQYTVGDFRTKTMVLFGAVILLLLISCANVGNLLLSRGLARQREVAARMALGAARSRILAQLVTESVLIALAGGVIGVLLAIGGTASLKSMLPADTPYLHQITTDWRVLAFALVISLITGVLLGLAPGFQAAHTSIGATLNASGDRLTFSRRRHLVQALLVYGEVALSLVLLIAAGLLVKTLWSLEHVELGFDPGHLLTARVNLNGSRCQEEARCRAYYDALLTRIRSLGGVKMAAAVNGLPLSGKVYPMPIEVEGQPTAAGALPPTATQYVITPEYISTMEIPMLRGRQLAPIDTETSDGVILVSAAMAEHFWPGQDALGKRIRPVWQQQWRTVVGIVGNVKTYALGNAPNWAPEWAIYVPYAQSGTYGQNSTPWTMSLVVAVDGDPASRAALVRSAAAEINPNVPLSDIQPLTEIVAASISDPKSTMSLLVVFASFAFALGLIGIYGVLSFAVRSRTVELGVRLALGAQRGDVAWLVVRQGLMLTLTGIAIGLVGAVFLTRILRGLLFGVKPLDPLVFVIVPVLMVVAAIAASYLPARRASGLDPALVLRGE